MEKFIVFAVSVLIALPLGAQVYYPTNGHIYQKVPVAAGIVWDDARKAAANAT